MSQVRFQHAAQRFARRLTHKLRRVARLRVMVSFAVVLFVKKPEGDAPNTLAPAQAPKGES